MLLQAVSAALLLTQSFATDQTIQIAFKPRSDSVDVTATWTESECASSKAEYKVSTFADEDDLESIHFVNTTKLVVENQPYWRKFTVRVEYFCNARLQTKPIKAFVILGPGSLRPVRHLVLSGPIASPTLTWKQNSLDVKEADFFSFDFASEGDDNERSVCNPNVTLKSPLPANSVISIRATLVDPDTNKSYTSEAMSAIFLHASLARTVMIESLRVEQIPRTNRVRVSWTPVEYIKDPIYSVTWIRPDRTEYSENTTSTSIEFKVQGAHGAVQEISVYVRDPGNEGLQVAGSEAATTFVYKSLPAPRLDLTDSTSSAATFDLTVAEENENIHFEVNGITQQESRVTLKNLAHRGKYLIRTRACFNGGLCGDTNYYIFIFVAPLVVSNFDFGVASSSELRASWHTPEGRNETSFSGYGLTFSEIKSEAQEIVQLQEVGSTETSYTIRYNETNTLYTLAISAYEEDRGEKISGPTTTKTIVAPRVNDEFLSPAPKLREIVPSIRVVTLKLEEVPTKKLQLTLVDSSGRWAESSVLEAKGNVVEYGPGLMPYQEYFGSLQACDDNDSTKCGLPRHFNFQTLVGAPSVPLRLEVTFINETRMEFRWEPPSHTGAPNLHHYGLKLKIGEDVVANKTVSPKTTDSAFDQLQEGTSYIIEVTAVNVDNSGIWFHSEAAKMTIATPSPAPVWILFVVVFLGVISGTAFFLIETRRKAVVPSDE